MGMYDTVDCRYPIPQTEGVDRTDFQTKDLGCDLVTYTITADGLLLDWEGTPVVFDGEMRLIARRGKDYPEYVLDLRGGIVQRAQTLEQYLASYEEEDAAENAIAVSTGGFRRVPRTEWPRDLTPRGLKEFWVSPDYLVQRTVQPDGQERLSINRTTRTPDGARWADGITWDELQAIKRHVGCGDCWAVEVYPPDAEVVDVANIRHLWLLPSDGPNIGWRASR
jgi:hypothetical protein